jgi:hypothetical protein
MKTAVLAALLGNTQAISIRAGVSSEVDMTMTSEVDVAGIAETCMSNYNRTMTQAHWTLADATQGNLKDGKYEDASFPPETSSLYWSRQ